MGIGLGQHKYIESAIMLSRFSLTVLVALLIQSATSFTTSQRSITHKSASSSLFLVASPQIPLPPPEASKQVVINPPNSFGNIPEYPSNYLQRKVLLDNVNNVAESSSSPINLPSMSVSLKDRVIPTKEEIAQKKLTFNLIFWGGGIIAPFIATVFYFGFRFWER